MTKFYPHHFFNPVSGESRISSNMTISAFYRTQELRFNVPWTYLCLIIRNKIGLPPAIGLFKWNHLTVPPPHLSSQPPTHKISRPPTSILTIRSLWAGPPPPCGRPHTVDMKYTPLS